MLTVSTKRTVLSSPLLHIAVCLIAGTFFGWNQVGNQISTIWFFITALMLVVLAGISYYWNSKGSGRCKRFTSSLSPLFFALFCLIIGYARARSCSEQVFVEWPAEQQKIEGIIVSVAKTQRQTTSFQLQCNTLISEDAVLSNAKVMVYVKDTSAQGAPNKYEVGKRLSFEGTLKAPSNRGNPDEFDYARWLRVQGVSGIVWTEAPRIQTHKVNCRSFGDWKAGFKTSFLKVRTHLASLLQAAGFEGDTLAIVSALTLGDKSLLSQETKNRFSDAGASHLLALSGLHLSILIGLLLPLFQGRLLLSRWRWLLAIALFAFIWGYALLAGLPTSLVRACTMTSVFLLGGLLNRQGKPFNHLLLAAIIMMLTNPAYVFDLGAQLSFCAVLGIICYQHFDARYQRWIAPRMRSKKFRRAHNLLLPVLSIFMVSLFAQIFTLPLVSLTFHQIPLYAPLFNILFIPITTLLIYYIVILMLTMTVAVQFFAVEMPLSSNFQQVITWVPNTLVQIETSLMKFENEIPGAVIEDFWSRKAAPQIVIYNNSKAPALHLILSPEESYLLLGNDSSYTSVPPQGIEFIASTFWKCRLTEEPSIVNERLLYEKANAHGIKEIDQLLWVHTPVEDGQSIDSLVLAQTGAKSLETTKLVILDACISYRDRKYWQRIAAEYHIPVFDGKQGAFCCGITPKQ